MQITFYSPTGPAWNWRKPPGGSETVVVQLSRRLAQRGHSCRVYAPMNQSHDHDGPVEWRDLVLTNWKRDGAWYLHRCPEALDNFDWSTVRGNDQPLFLWCDDIDYANDLDEDRASKLQHLFGMCSQHAEYLKTRYSFAADKVVTSTPGIQSDRLRRLPPQERDPFRLIYPSSPDRGLEWLLHIFRRLREFDERFNLHVHYGWKVIDAKARQPGGEPIRRLKAKILALDCPGVTWHGWTEQEDLWLAYQQASFWCYPCIFAETACVAGMEAQALGCIPIFEPYAALTETVRHGIPIGGDPRNDATRARYLMSILQLAESPELCEKIRAEMVVDALEFFDWENTVSQHDAMIREMESIAV